jgi:hypothetical protein
MPGDVATGWLENFSGASLRQVVAGDTDGRVVPLATGSRRA